MEAAALPGQEAAHGRWVNLVRVATVASILLVLVNSLLALWILPAAEILWRLRPKTRKQGLALAVAVGPLAALQVLSFPPMPTLLWTAACFTFAAVQLAMAAMAARAYYTMVREPRDRRTLGTRLALAVILVLLFALVLASPLGTLTRLKPLESAQQFELLSLDPESRHQEEEKPKDDFHGWKVLGRTQVADASTRKKLVTTLEQGLFWHLGYKCFVPRHGIRINDGSKLTDLVICFECQRVYVYSGDKRVSDFVVSGSPQNLFDETLRLAGVALPKPSQ